MSNARTTTGIINTVSKEKNIRILCHIHLISMALNVLIRLSHALSSAWKTFAETVV